jgi:hypothetical protein
MAAAVALFSAMALIAGLWLHSSIAQSVKASSIAVATDANANVSARLTREFDAVVAQVHFVAYVAFQSPPKTLSSVRLGQMFTHLVRSPRRIYIAWQSSTLTIVCSGAMAHLAHLLSLRCCPCLIMRIWQLAVWSPAEVNLNSR